MNIATMIYLENEIWSFFDAHGMGDEDHRLLSAEIAHAIVSEDLNLTAADVINHIVFVLYNVVDKNYSYDVEFIQKIRALMPCENNPN
jgi:predicted GTPase